VNAAGPWVESLFTNALKQPSPHQIKLIRGSHIVVPRLNQDERAYILQNSDGRIVFVLPYLNQFSLVGTTDALHTGSPDAVAVTPEEIDYLCATVNDYFVKQIRPEDIVWRYSGVRPLCDDESTSPQALTRDYTLDIHTVNGAPLLSVFGGKLTTYRKLSEKATAALAGFYPQMTPGWTKTSVVPGGDMGMPIADYIQQLQQQFPFLSANTVERLATSYGTRALLFLRGVKSLAELGQDFGGQFTAAEVDYLIAQEFVRTGEDALWRRTKMGIFLSEAQRRQVADYIESHQPASN
jgi:glycerol-3-phosphate dehydrogenase